MTLMLDQDVLVVQPLLRVSFVRQLIVLHDLSSVQSNPGQFLSMMKSSKRREKTLKEGMLWFLQASG